MKNKLKLSEQERQKYYQKFLETWGEKSQLTLAVEEMSELVKEICKYLRYQDNPEKLQEIRQNLQEETADVANMIAQIKFMFGEAEIEQIRDQKLQHCLEKIDK